MEAQHDPKKVKQDALLLQRKRHAYQSPCPDTTWPRRNLIELDL